MSKQVKILLIIADVILVAGLIIGILLYQKRADEKETESIGEEALSRRYTETVRYQGNEYPLNRHVTSVLLIGTDNYSDDEKQNEEDLFYNENLADFLVILAFDHSKKTVTPFQICRDTMCDVPWIAVNGQVGGTDVEQITLAHSYGSGKEDSCVNTRNAVQDLLYGVPIQNYFAFTMDAVPLLNDAVGGVTVTLQEDIPALGDEYVKGAKITLHGKDALRFVRWRDLDLVDSNWNRMSRHRQYIAAFTEAAKAAMEKNPDLSSEAFRALKPYLTTDLSAEQVTDMVNYLLQYEIRPVVTPEGQYMMGEEYAEFYVNDASLWQCVKETFCS